jgi:hypothetical protein
MVAVADKNSLIHTEFGSLQRISLVFGCRVIFETR